jgi:hypothetical protein
VRNMRRREKLAWLAALCVLTCVGVIRAHIFRKQCLDYVAKYAYKPTAPEVLAPGTVSSPAIDFCAYEHRLPLWMDAVVLGWWASLIGTLYGLGVTILGYLRGGKTGAAILWRQHVFFITGLAITPIACVGGLVSVGGGHGSYVAARLVLPYAYACIGAYSGAGFVVCALALLQWPIYGLVLDKAKMKGVVAGVILLLHGVLCMWLFRSRSGTF